MSMTRYNPAEHCLLSTAVARTVRNRFGHRLPSDGRTLETCRFRSCGEWAVVVFHPSRKLVEVLSALACDSEGKPYIDDEAWLTLRAKFAPPRFRETIAALRRTASDAESAHDQLCAESEEELVSYGMAGGPMFDDHPVFGKRR